MPYVNKKQKKLYDEARRHTLNGYASRLLERAKERTPDTDLTYEFISDRLSSERCELTSIKYSLVNTGGYHQNYFAPSIDRIDSSKGYYKNNVQFILYWLNRAKGEFNMYEFKTALRDAWEAIDAKDSFHN